MDALPISVNRHQLDLMHSAIEQSVANLEKEYKTRQFASNDTRKEENILMYGTNQYDEAFTRTETIENQLRSYLDSWKDDPESVTPVSLTLDSYQLKILRSSLEQEMKQIKNHPDQQRLKDIMQQLPEYSLQEDSD